MNKTSLISLFCLLGISNLYGSSAKPEAPSMERETKGRPSSCSEKVCVCCMGCASICLALHTLHFLNEVTDPKAVAASINSIPRWPFYPLCASPRTTFPEYAFGINEKTWEANRPQWQKIICGSAKYDLDAAQRKTKKS